MEVVESTPAPVEGDASALSSKIVFKSLPMPNVKGNSPRPLIPTHPQIISRTATYESSINLNNLSSF
jgi:hypothetical protein